MKLLGGGGAVYKGKLDEVQRLFRTGEASPTDRSANGRTALMWAAMGKHLHVVSHEPVTLVLQGIPHQHGGYPTPGAFDLGVQLV